MRSNWDSDSTVIWVVVRFSVTEILKSGKKIKAISVIKVKWSAAGECSIKDLFLENQDENKEDWYFVTDCQDLINAIDYEETPNSENIVFIYIAATLFIR